MRARKLYLYLLTATLTASPLWNGLTQEPHSRFPHRSWDVHDGLPDNRIKDIFQTHDGYLWLGTRDGLARFDGKRFTVFNHANTPVFTGGDFWSLAEDTQGGLLACSPSGLYRFTGGQFMRFGLGSGLTADSVNYAIESVNSGLWVATGDGLNHRRDGVWTAYNRKDGLKGSRVYPLHEDSSGRIWVGSSGGLQVFDPSGAKFLTNWPAFFLRTNLVQAIYADARGDSWITLNLPDSMGRLMRLHGNEWSEIRSNYANVDGKTLLATSDQSMHFWLPSKHWRVWEWMEAGSNRLRLPVSPGDWVSSMCEDSGGNLWVGTMDHGLFCFQADADVFETFPRGLPNPNVLAGCEDAEGNVWIGTDGGLARCFGDSITTFTPADGLSDDYVRALALDDLGRVWIGTTSGLDVFENGRLRQVPTPGGELQRKIRAIACGRNESLWLGTDTGVLRRANGAWMFLNSTNGLSDKRVCALLSDRDGNVWIGTRGNGLYRWNDGIISRFTTSQGLASDSVGAIHQDGDGTVWIGTDGGISRWKDGALRHVTAHEGLIKTPVLSLLDDGLGGLWFGSEHGIYSVDLTELNTVADAAAGAISCAVYGKEDGLTAGGTNGKKSQPAAWKTRDGRLWFATPDGALILDPRRTRLDRAAPLAVIEQIWANGRPIEANLFENVPATQTGPARQNKRPSRANLAAESSAVCFLPAGGSRQLEFHFALKGCFLPERVRLRYRLDGFDHDWIDASNEQVARYANLPHGSYRFRVNAGNTHQVWSKSEAFFPFAIAPSLYQRGWFQTACGIGVLGVLASTYLWRTSALRHKQQTEKLAALAAERVRIAKDLHDGLGANLTRLSYLADQAGETISGVTPEQVRTLSHSTREMASALRDIIWAANPSDETLEGLVTRICQQAEELLSAAGIRCRFDLPAVLPQAPLAGEFRRSLLLAAKEALNNAARHSSATEVWIRAQAFNSTFLLSIEDNGIGFDTARLRAPGNGLLNMKSRIEVVGGEFRIESKPGGGARVAIRIPTEEASTTL